MLDKQALNGWHGEHTIASGFEEETEVDIHQTIEAETLVDPANFGQQGTAEGQQISLDGVHVGARCCAKFAQIVGYKAVRTNHTAQRIGQCFVKRLPDVTTEFDRSVKQYHGTPATGT